MQLNYFIIVECGGDRPAASGSTYSCGAPRDLTTCQHLPDLHCCDDGTLLPPWQPPCLRLSHPSPHLLLCGQYTDTIVHGIAMCVCTKGSPAAVVCVSGVRVYFRNVLVVMVVTLSTVEWMFQCTLQLKHTTFVGL